MAVITASPKNVKPTRPFTCSIISLTIEINDTRYSVDEIPAGECGTKAFRLTKRSATHDTYDVIHDVHGCVACDCPDYEARHRGTASMCKHGRALVELGLMPGPVAIAPTAEAPAPCCEPTEAEPCAACVCPTCSDASAPAPSAIAPDVALVMNAFLNRGLEMARDAAAVAEAPTADEDPDVALDEPEGPTDEDMSDYREWSMESDARDYLNPEPRLTLPELVERQVEFYRGWGTDAGDMIADHLGELAGLVRMTKASTPAEHHARIDVLDRDLVAH